MLFNGKQINCTDENGILVVSFDNQVTGSNVFNQATLNDLKEVLKIAQSKKFNGLIFTSAKDHFIFGADITEFIDIFKTPESEFMSWVNSTNDMFTAFENLDYPTVAAINGFALGGGFEICLTADFRVVATKAKIGLPETKLGIIPGWGGTARLPRIVGADHAIEWITSGNQYSAQDGLKIGIVDSVVEDVLTSAKKIIERANKGDLDWKAAKSKKKAALKLNKTESMMAFETAKGFVYGITKGNYPAPLAAIESIQNGARLSLEEAIKVESKLFYGVTQTDQAKAMVSVFLSDQYLKKVSKKLTKNTTPIKKAAVLGAGIMGGGIAYQSASTGTPIIMKDINDKALELGMGEANKLLSGQIQRKKLSESDAMKVISNITPTLNFSEFSAVNYIVEAVVENEKVKKSVLAELEDHVSADTILTSNTSTISITKLAEGLKRPEKFCGMHFFNPVHRMPLVEIIRGEKTSDETIAAAVGYALKLRKTPIVVNDCAGFLVNRVLFPYFNGFQKLITDGADFAKVDKVMEKFGWPMGPAYLLDVVGVDTAHHCTDIMGDAFPDRMKFSEKTVLQGLYEANRFGQKNSKGFYEYEIDKKGKPKKNLNKEIYNFLKEYSKDSKELSKEEIIDRMMIPMIIECARCLEEKITGSPQEVDMALLLGLGFPPFRAGPLKYADSIGLANLWERAKNYEHLGNMYKFTDSMVDMAKNNKTYY